MLYSLSGNHPQCPFVQMTDTEVTFLSCYNTVGHARVYVMALTSPPSLPLSRLWAELSVRRFMSSPLLIPGSSLLAVLPYSLSVFWKFKNLTLSVTTSLPTLTGILSRHTSQDPCRLSILILLPPLESLPDPKIFFFPLSPRVCQTLSSHHPPRLLEIRVCQTLKPHQSILQDEP